MSKEINTPLQPPQHPGASISEELKRLNITPRAFALHIKVSPSTLIRIINGQAAISAEMALRLEKALGDPAMKWAVAQAEWDLQNLRSQLDLSTILKLSGKPEGKKKGEG